jgi:hypothetical protein
MNDFGRSPVASATSQTADARPAAVAGSALGLRHERFSGVAACVQERRG